MPNTKVKHWAGFISPEAMKNEGWFSNWFNRSETAKKNNALLVVFEIPENSAELIEEIELLIQAKCQ